MAELTEGTFPGVGDLSIFTRKWLPAGDPRGIVVISHGYNSHSGYYGWTADQLANAGYAVYALDHRGRGKSEGERYFVESFGDYIADLLTFIRTTRSELPGKPLFLLGHSAGGVIASSFALDYPSDIDGLICESFAYRVPAPDIALAIIKGVSHVLPHTHVLKLPNKEFSRDPAVFAALESDPLIANEVQPTQTVAQMVLADERLSREFENITVPVLIIHGTADVVTRPEGSKEFYDRAGSADKELKLYDGYFHDPLNDVGKEVVIADIIDWLNRHTA